MTPRPPDDCAHERRPGTTVCLYCRADERAAVRQRRQRQLARLGVYGGGAALVAVAALAVFTTVRGDGVEVDTAVAVADAREAQADFSPEQAGAARPIARAIVNWEPAVPHGRTGLDAGMFAERTGDTVTVHFDTRDARTRRSDKFENVVRATLPVVLGEPARIALGRIPSGSLVAPGRLVESVGATPLQLPVGDGRVITLAPGSRMGQDGPLVVSYRAVVDAATPSPTS